MNRKCKGNCKKHKPITEFYRRIYGNDTVCIDCRIVEETNNKRRLKNKGRIRRKMEAISKGLRHERLT